MDQKRKRKPPEVRIGSITFRRGEESKTRFYRKLIELAQEKQRLAVEKEERRS
jgi:hypothetical protein